MKKIILIISILFVGLNAFSQNKIFNHIPENHQAVVHINLKKFFNSVNTDEGTKALLVSLKAIFPQDQYVQIEKFFNETLSNLKSQGFDFFNDLENIVVSSSFGDKNFLLAANGNFPEEAYNNIFITRFELTPHTSAKGIKMHTDSGNSAYVHYNSNKRILISSSDTMIEQAIDAIKNQKNILHNSAFRNIYNKSIKNRVINIFAAVSMMQTGPGYQNQQSEQGSGQMGIFGMLMQSLNGLNISIDFPAPISVDIKIFCKDPNTSVMINTLIQQQLPNLAPAISLEIQNINREIINLNARIKNGDREAESHLMIAKHKLCIFLLLNNAGSQIRSVLSGNDININYTWSRAIIQSAIQKAGLHYDLNKILSR